MIKNIDAIRILDEHRGDAVIVPTMMASHEALGLPAVTSREELDLPITGAMGKTSSFGLGLALARPERKVIILDGDGSLLMNLGSLVTVGDKAPQNLYHFVFDNQVYAVTGGQPVPGAGKASLQGMAREAGYAAVYEFDDTEELASEIDRVLAEKGPVLVSLKIVPEIENTPVNQRQWPRRSDKQAIEEVSKVLGA